MNRCATRTQVGRDVTSDSSNDGDWEAEVDRPVGCTRFEARVVSLGHVDRERPVGCSSVESRTIPARAGQRDTERTVCGSGSHIAAQVIQHQWSVRRLKIEIAFHFLDYNWTVAGSHP